MSLLEEMNRLGLRTKGERCRDHTLLRAEAVVDDAC